MPDSSLYRCNPNIKSFNISLLLQGQDERIKSTRLEDINRTITDSYFRESSRLERVSNLLGDKGRESLQTAVYAFQERS